MSRPIPLACKTRNWPAYVADLRRIWIGKRQPFMVRHLARLAFIDETSVKTNMARTTGWAPRGQRLARHHAA